MPLTAPVPALLTEEESHQVCRWLGEFVPPARIPDRIRDTFGKTVSHQYASEFQTRKKWGVLIDRYRQEWLTAIYDVPLANKKVRLQKLQQALDRLDATPGAAEAQERRLLALLTAARLEMEEKPDQTTFFFTNINQLGDEELLQRREALLKRIQQFRWPTRSRTDGVGHRRESIEATGRQAQEDGGGPQDVVESRDARGGVEPEDRLAREDAGRADVDASRQSEATAVHGSGGGKEASGAVPPHSAVPAATP